MYTNLAFEGAGVRSIAQVGALQGMTQVDGLLGGIQRIAGTSAGSVLALAMTVRYTPDEIGHLVSDVDFGSSVTGWDPIRLATRYGLYNGSYAKETLASWMKNAPLEISPQATFEDLHQANSKWSGQYNQKNRELHIFATNLNTNGVQRFSHECTPEVPVLKAIRASMSIPLLFEAVEINGDIFVDGGVVYNYPVTAFDFEDMPCRMPNPAGRDATPEPNSKTLGFYFEPLVEDNDLGWDTPVQFVTELIETTHQSSHLMIASDPKIRERTITIETGGIKTTNFNVSEREKWTLWRNGLEAACTFFEVPVPQDAVGVGEPPED